jgi:CD2 antigen cytoplasmic tail-binding protein 2
MAQDDVEVYQTTFEKLSYEVKASEAAAAEDDAATKFTFKWENTPDAEVYGPYTAEAMASWQDQDYFAKGADGGVWCKEVGKEGGDFYNSKRIDFELYT